MEEIFCVAVLKKGVIKSSSGNIVLRVRKGYWKLSRKICVAMWQETLLKLLLIKGKFVLRLKKDMFEGCQENNCVARKKNCLKLCREF